MHTALYRPFFFDFSVFTGSFINELAQFLTRCSRSLSGAFLGLLNNRSLKSRLSNVGQVSKLKVQTYGLSGILARSAGVFSDQRYFNSSSGSHTVASSRTFLGKRGDNLDRFLIRVKETAESFRVLSQTIQTFKFSSRPKFLSHGSSVSKQRNSIHESKAMRMDANLPTFMAYKQSIILFFCPTEIFDSLTCLTLGKNFRKTTYEDKTSIKFVQAVLQPSRGKFSSMESLISHFRLTSEG